MDSPKEPFSPRSFFSFNSTSEKYALLNERFFVQRWPMRHQALWLVVGMVCLGALFANLLWCLPAPSSFTRDEGDYENTATLLNATAALNEVKKPFAKPLGLEVIAAVMYSRRDRTAILDCYLQRNLASNGGYVDKVIFVPETGIEEQLDWLSALVSSTPGYYLLGSTREGYIDEQASTFGRAWAFAQSGPLYIQVSSETVFIANDTIASLVQTRLEHRDYFLISANVINQPILSWVHHHLGVVRPYRPEAKPPARPQRMTNSTIFDWHTSTLPSWTPSYPPSEGQDILAPSDYGVPIGFLPPFKGHRWLPYSSPSATIPTAVTQEVLSTNGGGIWSWTLGAQHHYSFLEHLENDALDRYKIPLWEFQHEKVGMSFVCIWGADIVANRPLPGGSEIELARFLSVDIPQRTGRGAVVDGKALVVRFAHEEQREGLESTDLLDRYRGYAEENVC
jgi:hypothetical protein